MLLYDPQLAMEYPLKSRYSETAAPGRLFSVGMLLSGFVAPTAVIVPDVVVWTVSAIGSSVWA